MNMRQIISGSAFMLSMLAIFGVTGIADSGGISLGTYIIVCIGLLLVMAVCIVIGDDELFEALMKPSQEEKSYLDDYHLRLAAIRSQPKRKNRR